MTTENKRAPIARTCAAISRLLDFLVSFQAPWEKVDRNYAAYIFSPNGTVRVEPEEIAKQSIAKHFKDRKWNPVTRSLEN